MLIFFINGCGNRNISPAIIGAVHRGDLAAVKLLVKADPSTLFVTDYPGHTPVIWAILNSEKEIANDKKVKEYLKELFKVTLIVQF